MAEISAYYKGHSYISGRPGAITDERTLEELEDKDVREHLDIVGEKYALIEMKEKVRSSGCGGRGSMRESAPPLRLCS